MQKSTSLGWRSAESGTSLVADLTNLCFSAISLALFSKTVDRAEVSAVQTAVFLIIFRGLTAARTIGRVKVDGMCRIASNGHRTPKAADEDELDRLKQAQTETHSVFGRAPPSVMAERTGVLEVT